MINQHTYSLSDYFVLAAADLAAHFESKIWNFGYTADFDKNKRKRRDEKENDDTQKAKPKVQKRNFKNAAQERVWISFYGSVFARFYVLTNVKLEKAKEKTKENLVVRFWLCCKNQKDSQSACPKDSQ